MKSLKQNAYLCWAKKVHDDKLLLMLGYISALETAFLLVLLALALTRTTIKVSVLSLDIWDITMTSANATTGIKLYNFMFIIRHLLCDKSRWLLRFSLHNLLLSPGVFFGHIAYLFPLGAFVSFILPPELGPNVHLT
mmetsp:Transcript_44065/g.81888  ORF Transcript_44065/g.81888 Transcript_44065/m.81888 type:complete len:137 (-) Transcript_44065:875-1285(-)